MLVIDAKNPAKSSSEGVDDAQLYTSVIRRSLNEPKPIQYCIGCNGNETIIRHFEQDKNKNELLFDDFLDENSKFESFKGSMNRKTRSKEVSAASIPFEYKKPDPNEIKSVFEACHKIIWRREFASPNPAFWEFCKLMFIKLNEDNKLRDDPELKKLIDDESPLPNNKIVFSTYYINTHELGDPNPISSLFRKFRDDFETLLLNGEKKRIFGSNEEIDLQPLTIKQVVSMLEHFDLKKIDEDLNGRLFQTFLSATMRGKELGQFFTPRNVVDFMTDIADIKIQRNKPYAPLIIDGCCGTGGFLIEVMAKLMKQLKKGSISKTLSADEIDEIETFIKNECLFGIDAGKNPPIARIARINMYLHGDGGTRIWFTDCLDKKQKVESTLYPELRNERNELHNILVKNQTKFDYVLTNPPFSMKKQESEADQRLILNEYEIRKYTDSKGKRKCRSSLKSNVMFLERYHDLLNEGGTLLTIIDESVLNTDTDKIFRDWLLKHFYIKAIISLPQNTFALAGAHVKTSILHLVKKVTPSSDQPFTFYAKSDNIGLRNSIIDESLNDLPKIFKQYEKFRTDGTELKNSKYFTKKLDLNVRRYDFEWNDPKHIKIENNLKTISRNKKYSLSTIGELVKNGICQIVKGKTGKMYVVEGIPIIKLRNVTNEGILWRKTDYVLKSFFDSNKKAHIKKEDILITSTGLGTIGRVAVVDKNTDCMADGHVATIRILDKEKILPDFLAHYLRSIFGQTQMIKYTVGSTGQTELNDKDIERIQIMHPESISEQQSILDKTQIYEKSALESKKKYDESLSKMKDIFLNSLKH